MITLDDALDLAYREGIEVDYCNLETPLLGMTIWYPNMPPIIALDKSLREDHIIHKEILTEEIGHVFTATGNAITRAISPYKDRCAAMKCETQGMVWQANYLVPFDELSQVMKFGMKEVWELSVHFEVSHKLMWRRLNMSDAAKLRFKLGSELKRASI